jgi:hypothetical protein
LFLISVTEGRFALRGLDTALPVPSDMPMRPAAVRIAPNPFNPLTTIAFDLAQAERIEVCVYDLAGRLIRRLHDGALPAGPQRVSWNGRDERGEGVGAGVYMVRVVGATWQISARMTFLP